MFKCEGSRLTCLGLKDRREIMKNATKRYWIKIPSPVKNK